MRKYLIAVIALLALMITSLGVAAASPSKVETGPFLVASPITSSASGRCSKAEAIEAVRRLGLRDVSATYPVYKVLCGPFAGAGSRVMVASISGDGNIGMLYWAVFRWSGSKWQLLMKQRQAAILTAAGSDIRESVSIYRVGDPRCCPSGGTKARTWHWNGSRFVASAWKEKTPGAPATTGTFKYGYFKTPSGNIQCDYGYGGQAQAYVRCGIKSGLKPAPPSRGAGCIQAPWVSLGVTGRVRVGPSTCPGEDAPDAGPFAGAGVGRVLGYGKTWSGGGLRCTSAITGLTCRNKSGHGFFLSREHWRAF
jgi:hypothetical protein